MDPTLSCSCCAVSSITILFGLLACVAILINIPALSGTPKVLVRLTTLVITAIGIGLGLLANSRNLSNRFFASFFSTVLVSDILDEHRCDLLGSIEGRVLEIGAGPGANMKCWMNNTKITEWVGLDSNKYFEPYLIENYNKYNLGFPMKTIWLPAEAPNSINTPASMNPISLLANQTFDAIVATHVLCSVHDVDSVLLTVAHALRRPTSTSTVGGTDSQVSNGGGVYYFLEHVAAAEYSLTWYMQRLVAPVLRILGNGCQFKHIPSSLQNAVGPVTTTTTHSHRLGATRSPLFPNHTLEIDYFNAPIPVSIFQPHIKGTIKFKSF